MRALHAALVLSLSMTSLLAALPTVTADCTVNQGTCDNGNCLVNFGKCEGAYGGTGGSCKINAGDCSASGGTGGECLVVTEKGSCGSVYGTGGTCAIVDDGDCGGYYSRGGSCVVLAAGGNCKGYGGQGGSCLVVAAGICEGYSGSGGSCAFVFDGDCRGYYSASGGSCTVVFQSGCGGFNGSPGGSCTVVYQGSCDGSNGAGGSCTAVLGGGCSGSGGTPGGSCVVTVGFCTAAEPCLVQGYYSCLAYVAMAPALGSRVGANVSGRTGTVVVSPQVEAPTLAQSTPGGGMGSQSVGTPGSVASATTPSVNVGTLRLATGPTDVSGAFSGATVGPSSVATASTSLTIGYPSPQTIGVPAESMPVTGSAVPAQSVSGPSPSVEPTGVPPQTSQTTSAGVTPATGGVTPAVDPSGGQDILVVTIGSIRVPFAAPPRVVSVGGGSAGVFLDVNGASTPIVVTVPAQTVTGPLQSHSVDVGPLSGGPPAVVQTGSVLIVNVQSGGIDQSVEAPVYSISGGGEPIGVSVAVDGLGAEKSEVLPAYGVQVPP